MPAWWQRLENRAGLVLDTTRTRSGLPKSSRKSERSSRPTQPYCRSRASARLEVKSSWRSPTLGGLAPQLTDSLRTMDLSRGNIGSLLEGGQDLLDRGQVGCHDGLWGRSPRVCVVRARCRSLVDLVRGLPTLLPGLPATATLAHLVGHLPAGSEGLGLRGRDQRAVDVAELVGGAASENRPGALAQVGGDDAEGLEMAGAALDDLDVVEAGELGVEVAGGLGGAQQGGAEQARAGL